MVGDPRTSVPVIVVGVAATVAACFAAGWSLASWIYDRLHGPG
jgi:hypothetical protein